MTAIESKEKEPTEKNSCKSIEGSVIAIGNFDGLHLGHRKIFQNLKTIANEKKLTSQIMTFIPNPKLFFKREKYMINTDDQKRMLLASLDIDRVAFLDFKSVVNMSNRQFLKEVLVDEYKMKHIVMGENFRFGKDREGDISFLKEASARWNFEFTVVTPVLLDGIRISSSLIRQQLVDSRITLSNRMLGRDYFIEGIVEEGHRVGRELGYPTININTPNTILPEGVYQTTCQINDHFHRAISYIGSRPTFDGKEKKVETHIFDFDRDIYGQSVRVWFQRKIRGDMKFNDQQSLVIQIKKDIDNLKIDLMVDKGTIF